MTRSRSWQLRDTRPGGLFWLLALAAGCHGRQAVPAPPAPSAPPALARIYYWRARPGKIEEYGRYIREVAEPIDREAQRRGAFVSITTAIAPDSSLPWTHMRVFVLRDSAQLAGLAAALDSAGRALEPDSARRDARRAYTATLRDFAGEVTLELSNGKLPYVPLPGFAAAPVHEGWIPGAGGVRLFYRLVGSGQDTLVFVHGGPGTGMREGYDFERLTARGHALLMYDQRGAGLSELVGDSARLGVRDHADDLEAVLRHFRLRRARVIGLSWGAAVVATWAARSSGAVDRIVFVSPISPTRTHLLARFAHLDSLAGRADAGGLAARLRAPTVPPADSELPRRCRAERIDLYRSGGPYAVAPRGDTCDYPAPVLRNRLMARVAGLASLGARYDLIPILAQVRAPALVTEGERSNVPLDATRAFAAALPAGRLVLIPEAGHQSWLDRPDVFFPVLDDFMRGR